MSFDPTPSPASADPNVASASQVTSQPGWWFQVVRVRLRFLIIIAAAGVLVSQWPTIRNAWDRWMWSSYRSPMAGSVSTTHEYFCPMDPGQVSAWPGICSICNMDLVARKKMDAVVLPEGVVARMQLSPYRIQLAGIRTTVVEARALTIDRSFSGILRRADNGSLGFETTVAQADIALFATPQPVEIRTVASAEQTTGTASLIESQRTDERSRLQIVSQENASLQEGLAVTAHASIPDESTAESLTVPESAVIDRGRERLVYVETMPGMFDGVSVELGGRHGSFYPVKKGLKPGQRVATAGAFLIDAETRLNPALAAGYFGANQSDTRPVAPSSAPAVKGPLARNTPKKALSTADQALVDKQKICPVTQLSLTSMGGPVPVEVSGRKVFICCAGCEQRLKDEPEKYLALIPAP